MMRIITCLFCVAFLVYHTNVRSQDKHKVCIGLGINVRDSWPNANALKIGPSIMFDYGYKLNPKVSVGLNVHSDISTYGKTSSLCDIGLSVRCITTPFVKTIDWLRCGIGLTFEYRRNFLENPGASNIEHLFGVDFPIQLVCLNNSRFELYLFYDLKTMFDNTRYYWNYSNGGICWGIKF